GVARRTALEARRSAARRQAREAKVTPRTQAPQDAPSDLLEVLDEALAGLPEKYRAAVVLCDLEGKTRREAAGELGWAEGTVASRLARGRQLLARRLSGHGLDLTAGALAVVLSGEAALAVPAPLVSQTARAAGRYAAGQAVASATVAALTER